MAELSAENLLMIVKKEGPVTTGQIKKKIGGDTLLIGAVLSGLVDAKKVMVSHTKVGGSPAYYVRGQEKKLQGLARHLSKEEQDIIKLLKRKKVLKDNTREAIERIMLRSLEDFAQPIGVKKKDKIELYWKWYLSSVKEAEKIILGKNWGTKGKKGKTWGKNKKTKVKKKAVKRKAEKTRKGRKRKTVKLVKSSKKR